MFVVVRFIARSKGVSKGQKMVILLQTSGLEASIENSMSLGDRKIDMTFFTVSDILYP